MKIKHFGFEANSLLILSSKSDFDRGNSTFLNLQLWQIKVLQSLELWWWKVAHLKVPNHIHLYPSKKQHTSTFNICQDVLKSAHLLHKLGIGDSQSNSTVSMDKESNKSECGGFDHYFIITTQSLMKFRFSLFSDNV